MLGHGFSVDAAGLPTLTAEAYLERCEVMQELAEEREQERKAEERRKSALSRARKVAGDEWR